MILAAALSVLLVATLPAAAEPVKVSVQRLPVTGSRSAQAVVNVPVGTDGWNYFANVTVGGGVYNLLVDTGSANTWVGANKSYVPGPNAINTGAFVSVTYGSGSFNGTEWTDDVTLAGLTAANQSIGVAAYSEGYGIDGIDGILGLGGIIQTYETVNDTQLVATWMDNLYSQGVIQEEVLGVYFTPLADNASYQINGELSIGGADASRYTGEITWAPASTDDGLLADWITTVDNVMYNGSVLGSGSYGGLFDTGTTNIYVPIDWYEDFLGASGGEYDQTVFLTKFTTPISDLGDFAITIQNVSFSLTPEQYIVPEHLYPLYNITAEAGTNWSFISTAGPDNFYIGLHFLENVYSVFDTTNQRIGFAQVVHSS